MRQITQSAVVRWNLDPRPAISAEDILKDQVEGFKIQDSDFLILEMLLRYNYATTQQISRMLHYIMRYTQKRLKHLADLGLVDQGIVSYRSLVFPKFHKDGSVGERIKHIQEWGYALAQKGMELLTLANNEWAVRWAHDWRPRSAGESRKLSIAHELGRNDMCLALIEYAAGHQHELIWKGPRESFQRIPPSYSGGTMGSLQPDSVLILDTGRPLFIEYERTGRLEKIHDKIRDVRNYLAAQCWKDRYVAEPWILYAVEDGAERIAGRIGGMLEAARKLGSRRYVLCDESAWKAGHWRCWTGQGDRKPLWDIILT